MKYFKIEYQIFIIFFCILDLINKEMEVAYQGLFRVLEAPRIRLQRPSWFKQPSQMTVFAFIMATYFLVTGGDYHSILWF